jgi:hypothetical protein
MPLPGNILLFYSIEVAHGIDASIYGDYEHGRLRMLLFKPNWLVRTRNVKKLIISRQRDSCKEANNAKRV